VTPYFLDLIAFREISNDIIKPFWCATSIAAIDFDQNGKAVYNVSIAILMLMLKVCYGLIN
jgi:hypothetical protein